MVEFSRLITTKAGQALNAKMIAGTGTVKFTKVCTSNAEYDMSELENLTEIKDIMQTSPVSKITRTSDTGVKVETIFSNYDLKAGYYMRTLGLYASDPDEEEILYAAAVSVSGQCYMPPNNGITLSSAYINLVYAVGNADNVLLNVDPGCFATVGDLRELEKMLADFQEKLDSSTESVKILEYQIRIHDADIEDLHRRLALLELMYATEISKNPFSVTFGDFSGLVVEGIWNVPLKRVEF